MTTHRVAIYGGDGIGPQVIDEALRVIDRAREVCGNFRLETTHFDWGAAYHDRHGAVVPPDYLNQLRTFDAIFLGALGLPDELPDHIHAQASCEIAADVRSVRVRSARAPLRGR